jgi:hypothetical protein
MLPGSVHESLQRHVHNVQQFHARDLAEGFGRVYLPTLRFPRTLLWGLVWLALRIKEHVLINRMRYQTGIYFAQVCMAVNGYLGLVASLGTE